VPRVGGPPRADRIVVVDGRSTDGTLEIASRYTERILSDGGRGVAAARRMGVAEASSRWVALVDADVVLPDAALRNLFDEFREGGYVGLQAGLHSVSGDGYWGRALVEHHRTGRSKNWFGLVATLFERDAFLSIGLDEAFLSGEDIELRVRLERAGARVAVSSRTEVTHRFGDGFRSHRANGLPMDGALPEPSASTAGGRLGFFRFRSLPRSEGSV
jgi:glycosyltransferase involved in cell wall biosynthesis